MKHIFNVNDDLYKLQVIKYLFSSIPVMCIVNEILVTHINSPFNSHTQVCNCSHKSEAYPYRLTYPRVSHPDFRLRTHCSIEAI